MTRNWKYLLVVIVIGVVVWTGWPVFQGFSNTEYSAYYREDRFLDVSMDDREDYVIGILGEPLKMSWNEGKHTFDYSLPRESGYYYRRSVTFNNGKMIEKHNDLISN